MMTQNAFRIYVIRDNVSKQLTPLFYESNDGAAIRQFRQFLDGVPFAPDNFDLHFVGILEADGVCIVHSDVPQHVANGASVVTKKGGE